MSQTDQSQETSSIFPETSLRLETKVSWRMLGCFLLSSSLCGYLIQSIHQSGSLKVLTVMHVSLAFFAYYVARETPVCPEEVIDDMNQWASIYKDQEALDGVYRRKKQVLQQVGFFLLIEPMILFLIQQDSLSLMASMVSYRWVLYTLLMVKNLFWVFVGSLVLWIQMRLLRKLKKLSPGEQIILIEGLKSYDKE